MVWWRIALDAPPKLRLMPTSVVLLRKVLRHARHAFEKWRRQAAADGVSSISLPVAFEHQIDI
jgi:hypothetical protein